MLKYSANYTPSHPLHTHTLEHRPDCQCNPRLRFLLTSSTCRSRSCLQCQSAEMPVCSRRTEPRTLYPTILVSFLSPKLSCRWENSDKLTIRKWTGREKGIVHEWKFLDRIQFLLQCVSTLHRIQQKLILTAVILKHKQLERHFVEYISPPGTNRSLK